jgi:hypothetical protein
MNKSDILAPCRPAAFFPSQGLAEGSDAARIYQMECARGRGWSRVRCGSACKASTASPSRDAARDREESKPESRSVGSLGDAMACRRALCSSRRLSLGGWADGVRGDSALPPKAWRRRIADLNRSPFATRARGPFNGRWDRPRCPASPKPARYRVQRWIFRSPERSSTVAPIIGGAGGGLGNLP